jgi:hypothetical protein
VSGDAARSWGCNQIHWIVAVDEWMGHCALAVILEDGQVQKLFAFRPIEELRYVARVLNSALGLTAGEQT